MSPTLNAILMAFIFLALVAAGGGLLMWLCRQAPLTDEGERHLACRNCGKLLEYGADDCPQCHAADLGDLTAAECIAAFERWGGRRKR